MSWWQWISVNFINLSVAIVSVIILARILYIFSKVNKMQNNAINLINEYKERIKQMEDN